jgi:mRNA interferase YafQ
MLTVDYSGKFKKDLKLMEKRGLDMRKIFTVMVDLENETPLQPKHGPHQLQGEYKRGYTSFRLRIAIDSVIEP